MLVTYNILIGGWCKDGESSKAEKLLGEMLDVGVKPNHVTYNTLMDGFCMAMTITMKVTMLMVV